MILADNYYAVVIAYENSLQHDRMKPAAVAHGQVTASHGADTGLIPGRMDRCEHSILRSFGGEYYEAIILVWKTKNSWARSVGYTSALNWTDNLSIGA